MGLMEDIAIYHSFQGEEDDIKHGMERGLFRILSCKAEVSLHSSNQAWLAGKSPMEF
jgi:hypothetical protein